MNPLQINKANVLNSELWSLETQLFHTTKHLATMFYTQGGALGTKRSHLNT